MLAVFNVHIISSDTATRGVLGKNRFQKYLFFKEEFFSALNFWLKSFKKVELLQACNFTKTEHLCAVLQKSSQKLPSIFFCCLKLIYEVYICICSERFLNFSRILAIHDGKKYTNFWSVSDYYFPALNGNNSPCISSI